MGKTPVEVTPLYGTDGNDILFLTQAALNAGDFNLVSAVAGGGGNDTIVRDRTGGYTAWNGAFSSGHLYGDAGFDIASYAGSAFALSANLTQGFAQSDTPNHWAHSIEVDFLDSVEGFVGTTQDDHIIGSDERNKLWGHDGDDDIWGHDGDDDIWGEDGSDDVWGGQGDDLIYGGTGFDKLYGEAGEDRLRGGDAADLLYGAADDDDLHGDDGNDTLYGGADDDALYGDERGRARALGGPTLLCRRGPPSGRTR